MKHYRYFRIKIVYQFTWPHFKASILIISSSFFSNVFLGILLVFNNCENSRDRWKIFVTRSWILKSPLKVYCIFFAIWILELKIQNIPTLRYRGRKSYRKFSRIINSWKRKFQFSRLMDFDAFEFLQFLRIKVSLHDLWQKSSSK